MSCCNEQDIFSWWGTPQTSATVHSTNVTYLFLHLYAIQSLVLSQSRKHKIKLLTACFLWTEIGFLPHLFPYPVLTFEVVLLLLNKRIGAMAIDECYVRFLDRLPKEGSTQFFCMVFNFFFVCYRILVK